MSIIALQTAMFVSFGGGEMLQKYMNAITNLDNSLYVCYDILVMCQLTLYYLLWLIIFLVLSYLEIRLIFYFILAIREQMPVQINKVVICHTCYVINNNLIFFFF